jgi:hypothetical protein
MIPAKKFVTLLLLFGLAACAALDPAQLPTAQLKSTIEIARIKALAVVAASPDEMKIVQEQQPRWGYYVLSGWQAQYWFVWNLKGAVVQVSGTGDIRTLDGATVTRRAQ